MLNKVKYLSYVCMYDKSNARSPHVCFTYFTYLHALHAKKTKKEKQYCTLYENVLILVDGDKSKVHMYEFLFALSRLAVE